MANPRSWCVSAPPWVTRASTWDGGRAAPSNGTRSARSSGNDWDRTHWQMENSGELESFGELASFGELDSSGGELESFGEFERVLGSWSELL